MKISARPVEPGQLVLYVEGRLDAETCNTLKRSFQDHVAAGVRYVTVEMSQVTFIDSFGLSALISGLKVLRQAGGGLNLANVAAQARAALKLTLLDTVLPIFETVSEAVAAHHRPTL
ncbi:MAG: STAS domain-containing protein [Anaerolineales bacterium]|nr:STAS domain-containing protein [Anaerolineales bacterium]